MWCRQFTRQPLGFSLAVIVGLLAVGTEASLIPKIHGSSHVDLLPRLGPGATQRPEQLCTFNADQSDNCALTVCDVDSNYCDANEANCGYHCQLLQLGDRGCIADNECSQGGCIEGTCTMVSTGGSCHLNRNCASSLCSEGGICVDPSPASLKINEICTVNEQCSTTDCNAAVDYTPYCRGGGTICESVSRCNGYQLGHTCASSAECSEGACVSGTCQKLPVDAVCTKDAQCNTYNCQSFDGGDKHCIAAGGGDFCGTAADCITGACNLTPTNGYHCKQNNYGETCRDNRDCLSRVCSGSSTCLAPVAATCSSNTMCASNLCENGKCSKLRESDAFNKAAECASGLSAGFYSQCGPVGCYLSGFCAASKDGDACIVDADCSSASWCSGSIPGSKSGTCAAGKRPASTTTTTKLTSTTSKPASTTTTAKSSTTTTSVKTTTASQSTTSKSTSTTVKPTTTTSSKPVSTTTSTKPATSSTTSKSTTSTKATTTIKTTTSTKTTSTTTTASSTLKPSAAACTANAVCTSGYCRKPLLSDGTTRAASGTCDTKKASGAKCYQNGGCLSGTCDKTKGVCA
ncbi:unnamed protein product [Tilletia controversa]|nr:unnamed protein product [Tilletia controversa]CAD6980364.1 unnamed protein product [Tilletia controversa]CAD7067944.1 unnamed protein product [Tilletia caries]